MYELPYKGAKEMIFVDDVENKEILGCLFHAMIDKLSTLKGKKK